MVEQPDAQQVSSAPQSCGERPIFGARRGISGGMIVGHNDRSSIEEDGGLKHFAGMDNAESQRPYRDNVHADAGVLGIETTDEELLTIEPDKAWAQRRSEITENSVWNNTLWIKKQKCSTLRRPVALQRTSLRSVPRPLTQVMDQVCGQLPILPTI